MTLFPLRLAPWELMMLLDDRPSHPMTFVAQGEFSGAIRREPFEQAISILVARHPLLACRVESIRRYPHWVPVEAAPAIVWVPSSESIGQQKWPLDLSREAGFRVFVRPHASGVQINWCIHHACCDGLAFCNLLGEVLAIYHALCKGEDWRTRIAELDPRVLLERTNFASRPAAMADSLPRGVLPRLRAAWSTVRESVNFISHWPRPIAARTDETDADSFDSTAGPLTSYSCDVEQTKLIVEAAQLLDVRLNDLLIAALFRVLSQDGIADADRGRRRLLRITMPTSLRGPQHERMPTGNVVSYAFLDRWASDCGDLSRLASGINEATRAIKRFGLSRQFVDVLAMAAPMPGIFRAFLRRDWCLSTAVLSNVGDFTSRIAARVELDQGQIVAGDLRLESQALAPPIRPHTSLAIAVHQYNGRLVLAAPAYDSAVSGPRIRRFLEQVANEAASPVISRHQTVHG